MLNQSSSPKDSLISGLSDLLYTWKESKDEFLFRQISDTLAKYTAPGMTLPLWEVPLARQLISDFALIECSWALMINDLLWRSGHTSFADFDNHRQFATFAASSSQFTCFDPAVHDEVATKITAVNPSPASFILMGNAKRFCREYKSSEDTYIEGILRFPNNPFIKLRLANLYLASSRISEAHTILHQLTPRYSFAREMMFITPVSKKTNEKKTVFRSYQQINSLSGLWLLIPYT